MILWQSQDKRAQAEKQLKNYKRSLWFAVAKARPRYDGPGAKPTKEGQAMHRICTAGMLFQARPRYDGPGAKPN